MLELRPSEVHLPPGFHHMQYERNPKDTQPIPYLMQVPDLRAHNTTYDWRMLFMLVLMALGSGRTNVLAIAQWTIPFGTEPWRACSPSG